MRLSNSSGVHLANCFSSTLPPRSLILAITLRGSPILRLLALLGEYL
jgi:hypothetical protein